MSSTTNKTVMTGVAVVVAAVLGVVGVGILDSTGLEQQFQTSNESEWNTYASNTNDVVVNSNGYLALNDTSGATYGNYDSVTLNSNESSSERYVVDVSLPNETSNEVRLQVGTGTEYDLVDGRNKLDVTPADSYTFELERNASGDESPRVESLTAYTQDDSGSLLRLVGTAGFGLLLLLVVVNQLNLKGKRRV